MSKWHTTEFCETCAKEFCCTSECKYHLLHRIKEAREEIEEYKKRQLTLAIGVEDLEQGKQVALDYVTTILDKLIESEVEE
jgi:hypothetical protein